MADEEIGVRVRLKERRKFKKDTEETKKDVDRIGNAAKRVDRSVFSLNARLAILQRSFMMVRPIALITALGVATQAASGLAAGIVALSSALGPLSGSLAVIPAGFLAMAQSMNVAKFAMLGVSDAVGGLGEDLDPKNMEKLTPEGQRFAVMLHELKPAIIDLQQVAQRGLFPGLEKGLAAAQPLLTTFRPLIEGTAEMLAHLAESAGQMFGSPAWQSDITTVGSNNVELLHIFGTVGMNLANALRHVLVAVIPLVNWIARLTEKWSASIAASAGAARESGRLAAFFERTRFVLEQLGGMLGGIISGFRGVSRAAWPLGSQILVALNYQAQRWSDWVNSAAGQNRLEAYFRRAQPVIWELGRLIRDITKAFFELGTVPGTSSLLRVIRTELLPAFVELVRVTTVAFAPALVMGLTSLIQLFAALAGHAGGLTLFVQVLTAFANALKWIANNVPGAGALMGLLVALGITMRLLPLMSVVSGTRLMIQAFNWAKTSAIGLAIAQNVAAAGARAWAAAQWLLNLAVRAFPVVMIITALVLLGIALVALWRKHEWFRNAVGNVWQWVKTAVANVGNFIKNTWNSLIGFFTGLPGRIGRAVSGMWNGIKDGFRSAINWIIGKWNRFEIGFGPVRIPGPVPDIPRMAIGTPNIPFLAMGGILQRSGGVVVGDEGPELLTLPRGARVDPLPNVEPRGPSRTTAATPMALGDFDVVGPSSRIVLEVDGRTLAEVVHDHAKDQEARS